MIVCHRILECLKFKRTRIWLQLAYSNYTRLGPARRVFYTCLDWSKNKMWILSNFAIAKNILMLACNFALINLLTDIISYHHIISHHITSSHIISYHIISNLIPISYINHISYQTLFQYHTSIIYHIKLYSNIIHQSYIISNSIPIPYIKTDRHKKKTQHDIEDMIKRP